MDTSSLEKEIMEMAEWGMVGKNHVPGPWESFLGGAIHVSHCVNCQRFSIAEVLPNGDDDSGNQVYETDIRGSAPMTECGARKVS